MKTFMKYKGRRPAWWCIPAAPATWRAEAGRSPEPQEPMPVHHVTRYSAEKAKTNPEELSFKPAYYPIFWAK